jgi:YARHG domain
VHAFFQRIDYDPRQAVMKTILISRCAVCFLYIGFAGAGIAAPPAAPASSVEDANPDVQAPDSAPREMLGTYVGAFGSNKITVCLQKVIGQTINGYSVVAGNQRAFAGSFSQKNGLFVMTAREPGDDPEDGVFIFEYRPGTPRLTGSWTPNNIKKLQQKSFDLERRDFRYNPESGFFALTSTRLLKAKDVENFNPTQLRVMRNEIYARHGYCFRMKDMREYFDAQDWYMPISLDVTAKLSDIEQKNAALIKRYEKYGAEHYDKFGR